jgi:hypothetical protein
MWGDFRTISYTWGNSSMKKNVIINGKEFPVTEHLFDILWWFEENPDEYNIRAAIWVDAI